MPQTTSSSPPSLQLLESHSCSFMWFVRKAVILTEPGPVSLFSSLGGEVRYGPPFVFVPFTHLWQYATGEYLRHVVNAASLLWIRAIKARKLDFASQPGQLFYPVFRWRMVPSWRWKFSSYYFFFFFLQPDEHNHLSIVTVAEYLHDSPGREPQFLLSKMFTFTNGKSIWKQCLWLRFNDRLKDDAFVTRSLTCFFNPQHCIFNRRNA